MKINIKKTTRTVEIPETVSKEYLIDLICKWSPIIANDANHDKYIYVPIVDPTNKKSNDKHCDEYKTVDECVDSCSDSESLQKLKKMFGFNK